MTMTHLRQTIGQPIPTVPKTGTWPSSHEYPIIRAQVTYTHDQPGITTTFEIQTYNCEDSTSEVLRRCEESQEDHWDQENTNTSCGAIGISVALRIAYHQLYQHQRKDGQSMYLPIYQLSKPRTAPIKVPAIRVTQLIIVSNGFNVIVKDIKGEAYLKI